MAATLRKQAGRFYQVFADLIRAYQFRDRNQICFYGITISQCYALEILDAEESVSMGELARALHLEPSSATRLVDQLVAKALATRVDDLSDRRVCRVRSSDQGKKLTSRIRGDLCREYEAVLREVPEESREAVIQAMARLHAAFTERQRAVCAGPAKTS